MDTSRSSRPSGMSVSTEYLRSIMGQSNKTKILYIMNVVLDLHNVRVSEIQIQALSDWEPALSIEKAAQRLRRKIITSRLLSAIQTAYYGCISPGTINS
ncbi:hypothetical protein DITRI_Ditri16bG0000900 [Diplodiscus trichospermus]